MYSAPTPSTPPNPNPKIVTITVPGVLDYAIRDFDVINIVTPGTYFIGDGAAFTERQNPYWVAIAPSVEGIEIQNVGDTVRPRANVKFCAGMALKFNGRQMDASPGGSFWADGCDVTGSDWALAPGADPAKTPAQPFIQWGENAATPAAKYYVTNCKGHDGFWGFSGCELVDGCTIRTISYGAAILNRTTRNVTIDGLNADSGRTDHRDVFHFYGGGFDGALVENVTITNSQAQVFNLENNNTNITFRNVDASGIAPVARDTDIGHEVNYGGPQSSDLYGNMVNILFENCIMPTQYFNILGTCINVVFKNCKLHWQNRNWIQGENVPPGVTLEGCTLASLQVNAPELFIDADDVLTWKLHMPVKPGTTYLRVYVDGFTTDIDPSKSTDYSVLVPWKKIWLSQFDAGKSETFSDILTPAAPVPVPTPVPVPPVPVPTPDPTPTPPVDPLAALTARVAALESWRKS